MLRDNGYGASETRGVPVYAPGQVILHADRGTWV